MTPNTEVMLKALVMDSLIAKSSQTLSSEVIRDITTELVERVMELIKLSNEEAIDAICF